MKFSALLTFALLLSACGKVNQSNGNNVGEFRSFNPVIVDSTELSRLNSICAAAKSKALAVTLNLSQQYVFDVTQKSCSTDSDLSGAAVSTVATIIKNDFTFVRADNNLKFVFENIVTNLQYPLSEICMGVSNFPAPSPEPLTSPKKLSSGALMYFTTSAVAGADCRPQGNQLCLLVEVAAPVANGTSYEVVSQEWLRFQLDQTLANFGHFVERKQITSAGCGTNQRTQTRAVLK